MDTLKGFINVPKLNWKRQTSRFQLLKKENKTQALANKLKSK